MNVLLNTLKIDDTGMIKVKAFDAFYDELRKELNKYAEELKSHAEA